MRSIFHLDQSQGEEGDWKNYRILLELKSFEIITDSVRYEYRHFHLLRVYDEEIFLFPLDMEEATSLVILLKQWLEVFTRQTS